MQDLHAGWAKSPDPAACSLPGPALWPVTRSSWLIILIPLCCTQFNSTSLNRHLARTYNMGSGVRFGGDGFVEVNCLPLSNSHQLPVHGLLQGHMAQNYNVHMASGDIWTASMPGGQAVDSVALCMHVVCCTC
jgi:hypothetical protein